MAKKAKLYAQGIEEAPVSTAIFANLMMILWIALGTIACWFLNPLIAWGYLAFALMLVYAILRKLVCANCHYYGKMCHIGWGKLSALLFRKGRIGDFPESIGIKIAPLVYGLLTLIPVVALIVSLVQEVTVYKAVVLLLILLVSGYSGAVGRKKACAVCKMRLICPGCAVK